MVQHFVAFDLHLIEAGHIDAIARRQIEVPALGRGEFREQFRLRVEEIDGAFLPLISEPIRFVIEFGGCVHLATICFLPVQGRDEDCRDLTLQGTQQLLFGSERGRFDEMALIESDLVDKCQLRQEVRNTDLLHETDVLLAIFIKYLFDACGALFRCKAFLEVCITFSLFGRFLE